MGNISTEFARVEQTLQWLTIVAEQANEGVMVIDLSVYLTKKKRGTEDVFRLIAKRWTGYRHQWRRKHHRQLSD